MLDLFTPKEKAFFCRIKAVHGFLLGQKRQAPLERRGVKNPKNMRASRESESEIKAEEELGPWVRLVELEDLPPEIKEKLPGLTREINGETLVPRRTIRRLRNENDIETNGEPERIVNGDSHLNRAASSGEGKPNPSLE